MVKSSWRKFVKHLRSDDYITLQVSDREREILERFEEVKLSEDHKISEMHVYITDSDGLTYVVEYVRSEKLDHRQGQDS